ncbi:hypothetical protein GW17_00036116, partial [Ensete ventricosum]
ARDRFIHVANTSEDDKDVDPRSRATNPETVSSHASPPSLLVRSPHSWLQDWEGMGCCVCHLTLVVLLLFVRPAHSSESAVTVDVHAAKGFVDSGHKYLDVRCMPHCSIHKLIWGREKNPEFLEQVSLICDKDDHIVVGFKHVKNMGGGYVAWVENGFLVKALQEEL